TTCIKGHRSTTCNHGERPLHEIKKKGRPSIQCSHCKELRKAKHVTAKCICPKEEVEAAAVANGLKRAKSLSHDGRISVPTAQGGEDVMRSVSQCQSPVEGGSHLSSPIRGLMSCGCIDGTGCTCGAHPSLKSSSNANDDAHLSFRAYQQSHQRSAVSLDLGKAGIVFNRDTSSPLPFAPHINGGQLVQNPEGHLNHGINGMGSITSKALGGHGNGISPLFAHTMSPGSSVCDHSPSSSMGSQMQPHLCFDYASSSDYDSDHYPTSSYSYFPETLTSYPVSNASDDMEDVDVFNTQESKKIMDDLLHASNMNSLDTNTNNDMQMLYTALSGFNANSPAPSMTPPVQSFSLSQGPLSNGTGSSSSPSSSSGLVEQSHSSSSLSSSTKKGCCGSSSNKLREIAPSPALSVQSTPSRPPSAGRSNSGANSPLQAEVVGCGCAISASMCCCGERCACPGCLAYPSNQTMRNPGISANGVLPQSQSQSQAQAQAQAQAEAEAEATEKSNMALLHDLGLLSDSNEAQGINGSHPALNLSDALNLIGVQNGRVGENSIDLRQEFSGMGTLNGFDMSKLQHPTLLGDDGVLICGCGCRRPTVDCTECFRDMCQFVGESQAKMLKDDLVYSSAVGGGASGDSSGMDLSMPMSMNMHLAMNMNMNMDMGGLGGSSLGQPQTMCLLMQRNGSGSGAGMLDDKQQHQQSFEVQGNQMLQDQELHQQLAQQMQQRLSLRKQFRETIDEEQRLQLELMEKEQMQIQRLHQQQQLQQQQFQQQQQQLQQQQEQQEQQQQQQQHQSTNGLNPLQLNFLGNQDWNFVDEIQNDGSDLTMTSASGRS
ncbi:hypothetical protein BG004_002325, partial [Podila humilis]